ncbi:MAG: hypothetical protein V1494_00700 [Candidatus Diapherotrites archaeon]
MVWGAAHYNVTGLLLHPEKRHKILAENRLEKFVHADYPQAIKFRLDKNGKITELKEFPTALKVPRRKQKEKATPPMSRRDFFKTFKRRTRA